MKKCICNCLGALKQFGQNEETIEFQHGDFMKANQDGWLKIYGKMRDEWPKIFKDIRKLLRIG